MRKTFTRILWWGCVTFLVLTTQTLVFAQQTEKTKSPDSKSGKVATTQEMVAGMNNDTQSDSRQGDNPKLRLQYEFERLKDPRTGEIPSNIREKELTYVLSPTSRLQEGVLTQARIKSANPTNILPGDAITAFTSRGLFHTGGRTRALAIDANDENRLLAGAVSGGIWLSSNQGASWQRVSPLDQNPSITAIVQDKRAGYRNIWYACTGEATGTQSGRNDSAPYLGNGIYKSVNNGLTWALLPSTISNTPQNSLGEEPFESSTSMAIDPANGDLYISTCRGIQRTQDGGISFESVLPVADFGFTKYLDIHITSNRVLYAAIPSESISARGPGNAGIYRSTTGNLNEWTRITPPVFPKTYDRVSLTTAPSDENVLYVFTSNNYFFKYTYLSGDGTGSGGQWEDRSKNVTAKTQNGYCMYVRVHPTNANMVFLGAVDLYRSTDGFATKSNTSKIGGLNYPELRHHGDQQSMEFFQSNPNKVLSGHDGGISITDDITVNTSDSYPVKWESLNNGYITTQAYAVAIGPGNVLMAGFQDNMTWATASTGANATWEIQLGGDGCATAINKTGTIRYVSAQGGLVYRTLYDNGNDNIPYSYAYISPSKTGLFVTQFELDPNDDRIMYFLGYNTVWRTNDATTATTTTGWTNLSNTSNLEQLSAVGISRQPANIVYIGTIGGKIYRIDNTNTGNPMWVDVHTGKGLPSGNVSCIAVDPTNSNRAIATFSNYSIKSIWLTEDGGTTWSDISGNLEQNPDGTGSGPSVRWMTIVGKNNVYLAATSTGLYSTKVLNGTATVWTQVAPDILGIAIAEQVRSREDGLVVVGTHGNGVYSAQYQVDNVSIHINESPPTVSVLKNAYPVIVPIGNVFRSSNASAINISVDENTNDALVSTLMDKSNLTLIFTPDATGRALITLKGVDSNDAIATVTFAVNVNPVITSFPYVTRFTSAELPLGFTITGNMDWRIRTGPTPSSHNGTGPLGDHTESDGSGFYVHTESSVSNTIALADLSLPLLDLATLKAPNLSFFYYMYGATTGSLEVIIKESDTGKETKLLNLTGQQHTYASMSYTQANIPLSQFASSGRIQIIFRGIRGNGLNASSGDIAIDDIIVGETQLNDIGIKSVIVKEFIAPNAEEYVSVEISNYGTLPATNFDIAYQIEGGPVITEKYTGTLNALETQAFTFATKFNRSVNGPFTVSSFTLLTGDANTENNIGKSNSLILPAATLPYQSSFEYDNGGWTTRERTSSWAWGVPAAEFIYSASDGNKAWVTNLAGNYPNSESSFVMSPLFSIPEELYAVKISLDIRYKIESGYDGAALQYSTDVGKSWANVGKLNDGSSKNWYTGQSSILNFTGGNGDAWTGYVGLGYVTASSEILNLSGKTSLLFRLVFGSDYTVTKEGIAFDNVFIEASPMINFDGPTIKKYEDAPFKITVLGTSCEPVTYTSENTSVVTILGDIAPITGAGEAVITASHDGNGSCSSPFTIQRNLTVQKAVQSIVFDAIPTKSLSEAPFTLSATGGSSGEPVAFESVDDKITISGTTATIIKAGRANISATQLGNTNYYAATAVNQSFCIKPVKPVITISNPLTDPSRLTSSATVGNQWYKDGIAITGATGVIWEVTETGSYTVVSTVDDCASEPSAANVVIITGEPKPVGNTDLGVYPNPVDDELTLQLGSFTKNNLTLTILDLTGRKLIQREAKGGDVVQMKVGQLAAGNYIVRIVQKDKWAQVKFIKR